jgi:hypothetical protein
VDPSWLLKGISYLKHLNTFLEFMKMQLQPSAEGEEREGMSDRSQDAFALCWQTPLG